MIEIDKVISTTQVKHDEVREKAVDVHRNSILIVAPIVNERFGLLSDDTPIEEVVHISRDSDMRNPIIELTSIWHDIELQDFQSDRIARIFASLTLARPSGLTIGKIRELARTGEIRKMVGLSKVSEVFLADSFKKREII
jgi:hypothetical protein